MVRTKGKCRARGKSTCHCDYFCRNKKNKCPLRDKFRDFRHSKKNIQVGIKIQSFYD